MIWLVIISILISIEKTNTLISIGANLDRLSDWSRSVPYVNLVRQARPWGSPDVPYDHNATSDPVTGCPTCDFGMLIVVEAVDVGGAYLFQAKGNANISIYNDSLSYISSQTYDLSTNTITAVINMVQNTTELMLSFRNTTGPGLQDIALLQPGYDITAKSNLTNLMLTHLSRFTILRFMD